MLRTTTLIASAALIFTACSDVDLRIITNIGAELGVEGEVCVSPPASLPASSRVLFLVDSSNSMTISDPNHARCDALAGVMQKYEDYPNVQFAVARWGDGVIADTPAGFTNDPSILATAIERCREEDSYLGGTNYKGALDFARDLIEADASDEERNDYIVEFITDGTPTADDLTPANLMTEILLMVDQVKETAIREGGSGRVDVLFFGSVIIVPPGFGDLLPAMARRGGGQYLQVFDPMEAIEAMTVLVEVDTWIRTYSLRQFFVHHRNTRLTRIPEVSESVALYVDSDGDGLVDELELQLGTSLYNSDTDGDGVSDFIESVHPARDPLLANEILDALPGDDLDPDYDGLNNREERLLVTDPKNGDTDEDGIPDGLEVWAGTFPTLMDAQADYDDDLIANIDEIRQQTNPWIDEGETLRAEHAFRYQPAELTNRTNGMACYSFSVDNLRLVESDSANPDELRPGYNQIDLFILDAPEDAPERTHSACSRNEGMIFFDGMREPSRLSIDLRREDFCHY